MTYAALFQALTGVLALPLAEWNWFDYVKVRAAQLSDALVVGRNVKYPAGKVLIGYVNKGEELFCDFKEDRIVAGVRAPAWVCLVEKGGRLVRSGFFTRFGRFKSAKDVKSPPRVVIVEQNFSNERALELRKDGRISHDFSRREVIYQGAAGGVLRLMFREYVNDMARPAFSQELTYDLGELPFTVSVKGAKITVYAAGNDGLAYQVTSGFE